MATYSTPANYKHPVLQYEQHLNLWRLVEDYVFIWFDPKTKRNEKLTIPAGEVYDKASTMGLARHDAVWEGPSLHHDMGYKFKGVWPEGWYKVESEGAWIEGPKWSRWRLDWFLGWEGKLGGARYLEASKFTWAVRVFPPNWVKGF